MKVLTASAAGFEEPAPVFRRLVRCVVVIDSRGDYCAFAIKVQ